MSTKRRTNLREIGQKLGLSASTVSRALRELPGIHPETRQQVFETAQRMGYRGGELLNSKRFSNILTLSQGINLGLDLEYLAGMSSAAIAMNLSLISHHCRSEECANILNPEFQPRALSAGHVDGIVLIHRWPIEIVTTLQKMFPVVSIIHDYPGTEVDVVSIDYRDGMNQIVKHLVAGGCRRIGFFGLCHDMSWSLARFGAFVEAMLIHRQEVRMQDVTEITLPEALSESESDFQSGAAMLRAAELTREGVDAWVCPSEMIARSLYHNLYHNGFKVPENVAITGFHKIAAYGPDLSSTLTSTDISNAEIGSAALRRLVYRIEDPQATRRNILLPCTFRKGTTTREPR